ncbi:MAG TPA: hypothetical protein VKP30_07295 [Polyangiaceae bacterium]|nr:hypothetical protein [Polyangiaceae bacterium]
MSDPARLLETNLDGTFRRAIDAAIADEPPRGEQSRIWQSIALALPSGVLLGATTSAGAAAVGGSAVSNVATVSATNVAVTSTALNAASNVALTSTALNAASNVAVASTAIGSTLKAAAVGGIASASAGVGAGAGVVSGGLGLVAAKAIAVGLGLGLVVNATAVTVPDLLNANSAASAHVAPAERLPPQRAKPKSPSPARLAQAPAVAATSLTDSALANAPSTSVASDARAISAVTTSNVTPAPRAMAVESIIHDSPVGFAENGPGRAEHPDTSEASADELRDESRLLARARQALNASNPSLAIQLIADHRQGFPAGRLVQERDALEVQALQKSARHEEARARARAFLVHFPMSPHAEKMRAIAESSSERQ